LRIQATLLVLLALFGVSQAQLKVTLKFDSSAPREVFVAGALPKSPPEQSVNVNGSSFDYSAPSVGPADSIYVWDTSTNDIASKPVKSIQNGVWEVKPSDFTLIGTVTVHIEHKGQPIQAAQVSLSGKGKSESKLLDPTGKGDVNFFGYPVGDLKVKVDYNTLDKKQGSEQVTFTEPATRDKPIPVLSVDVSDDVATIGAASAAPPAASPGTTPSGNGQSQGSPQTIKGEKGASGNSVVTFFIELIVLALLAGGGWYLFLMLKHRPKEFEAALHKVGIQVPTQDPSPGTPIAVTPLAPAPPPPKIMLDDAEPVPLGTPVAVASPAGVSGGEPSLVSESGQRIVLAEGESTVGREDGLGLSLVGESTVSRRHATVTRTGKTAILRDLGSTNGTFVNGTRLQGEVALKPGDQVQFGSVRFRYEG